MIDLHTHSLLSDGLLLPSELVRRALVNGVKTIAITDHADHSNIGRVIASLVEVSAVLNRYWDIKVLPGVEITHVPIEVIGELVAFSRKNGAKIVVVHGESPVEPVIKGTNRAAIEAKCDILAHPGELLIEDAAMAASKGVYIELTARNGHNKTNKHVFDTSIKVGAKMVVNTDSHAPNDIMSIITHRNVFESLTDSEKIKSEIIYNSTELISKIF
ncbi:MAG: histidinol phosphate phosphatase domain-containing protein [Candidatus Omnitrophica bacterium]|nr:histidinol phosphate phosphatase domain-containing protein [Candidatus Omnitrophota bacterium]